MAYPTPSARLVFGGSLYNHTEIWSCSLGVHDWKGGSTLVTPDVVSPIIENWFAGSTMRVSGNALLEYVKLNQIDGAGHYLDPANTRQRLYAPPYPKGGIGATTDQGLVFPQLTIAISLQTAAARGHASKGRFFLPLPAVDAAATGRIDAVTRQNMAAATAEMIGSLNNVLSADHTGWQISVLSKLGAVRHVTGVRIGDVMDTQRRRRNAWPETYERAAVPNAQLDPGQAIGLGPTEGP